MRLVLIWFTLLYATAPAEPRPTPVQIATELGRRGLPYQWGATDPQQGGLDCSGFVRYVFQQAYGVTLPDEAGLQYEYLRQHGQVWDLSTRVWSPKDLQPGDLVFYSGTCPSKRLSPVTHVMMYVGQDRVVGAQNMGHRLELGGAGVGFYAFHPRSPQGDPRLEQPELRTRIHLFAYGRVLPSTPHPSALATITLP
jgi:cell wall-associated NlpC family hydrolase